MVRRGVAFGVGIIVLILIVIGIKSCVDGQHADALRGYASKVSTLANESSQLVSKPLFRLLSNPQSASRLDTQQQVSQLRVEAKQEVDRAKALSVPGEMQDAQRDFTLTLDLRSSALQRIANALPQALGQDHPADAVATIAGQMEVLLASDVVYSQRVAPLIRQQLDDAGLQNQPVGASRFLPRIDWLSPGFVAAQLGAATPGSANGKPSPGTHGHGLTGVSVDGTTLNPGAVARVAGAGSPTFVVSFQNQGQNDETDVRVRVKVRGPGLSAPIVVTKTVPHTTAGQTAQETIPLGRTPPRNVPLQVTVTVLPVPGEGTTSNNSQTYNVIFTG